MQGVELALDAGAALRVTGRNGAGKSTLLRVLAGFLPTAAGTVERAGRCAFLGHDNALKPNATMRAELGFWARLDGAPAHAVTGAAEALDLTPLLDLPVRVLSHGQRRRAALARVLAGGAEVWLLDEPEAGLDARARGLLEGVIARHRGGGGAVVVAAHTALDLPGADELAL